MKRNSSSLSKASTDKQIGDFWDRHSLADYWDKTKPIDVDVNIESEVTYYPVANDLAKKVRQAARRQGVSPETLLNMWVQEHVRTR